ncbi:MAG: bifunctional 5,10-methylene-tetrahydrofolate dehydrogenase/5,10-methylene-tetrahydrofolate cyclohydrolase, partial [Clostridia bacterium]|nr:bifunctional 5,10-methylene-tetrahydrofolate dehydrogenase/5,10-methylene-tetrahydrofolate cyclohydrolase [Clostridia bacterium]
MSAQKLDGKALSQKLREQMRLEVEELKKTGKKPGLAVILVGDDPASRVYVNGKKKACEELGIRSFEYALPAETKEEELLGLLEQLNEDDSVDGILVQLPLPKHLNETTVIETIRADKDVDAFRYENVGRIMVGNAHFLPCTPAGVMELIDQTGIDLTGKECVVIGRSNIVGKPQALLLLQRNATVTICHSKTTNLREITKQADIIVVAVGRPHFLTADMIKDGAVIIDVG